MLFVAPGNDNKKKPCINSTCARELQYKCMVFSSFNKRLLISCDTDIYVIISMKCRIRDRVIGNCQVNSEYKTRIFLCLRS